MGILPYQHPTPKDYGYLDTLLGIFAIGGLFLFLAVGLAQSALSDVAEMYPLRAAVIETTLFIAAMAHVGLVVLRVRRNWQRPRLPHWLVVAAMIDGLFVIGLLAGLLLPVPTSP